MEKLSEQNAIRILVVDDHPIVRTGLATLLKAESGFRLMGGVDGGEEALAFLSLHPVDIVLLDLRMPKMSGLDVLPAIQKLDQAPYVLILSSFDYEEDIYRAVVARLPRGLSLTADAPSTTVMEIYTRAESRETIVHFVNFDKQSNPAPFAVRGKKQYPGAVKSVTCLAPDADDPAALQFQERDGAVEFTVPATRVYSMVAIAQG